MPTDTTVRKGVNAPFGKYKVCSNMKHMCLFVVLKYT